MRPKVGAIRAVPYSRQKRAVLANRLRKVRCSGMVGRAILCLVKRNHFAWVIGAIATAVFILIIALGLRPSQTRLPGEEENPYTTTLHARLHYKHMAHRRAGVRENKSPLTNQVVVSKKAPETGISVKDPMRSSVPWRGAMNGRTATA